MKVKRGQIYYVDFGRTTSRSTEKSRPALVVQNDAGNTYSPYTIVVAIKHQTGKTLPVFIEVPRGEGGLKKDSTIDCGHIHTIQQNELFEFCGSLSPQRMAQVDSALATSLALRLL